MQSDFEPVQDEYSISCDPARIDLAVVHGFLSTSYWSEGLPLEVLQRAIAASLCFGVYHGGKQVGFARVVTDRATFAYLCDVFVLDAYRGQGLGRWLMEAVAAHPDLQGLRRMVLVALVMKHFSLVDFCLLLKSRWPDWKIGLPIKVADS
jgi:GNAT superfamily N-acetyltransferase